MKALLILWSVLLTLAINLEAFVKPSGDVKPLETLVSNFVQNESPKYSECFTS